MKKIIVIISIVVFIIIIGYVAKEVLNNEKIQGCKVDIDCTKNISDEGSMGMPIYPPCFRGECEYPKNSDEWIEYCDKAGSSARSQYIWNCYMKAAYSALKKSEPLSPDEYTIVWDDAFEICEEYIADDEERCKMDACDNLQLGDGSVKHDYPESKECYKQARNDTSCNDGVENGGETDTDCGGDCSPCKNDSNCLVDGDCQSGNCSDASFRCFTTCPNGLISENKPCNCGAVTFNSVTPGIPKGIYCCDGETQRDSCN